MVRIYPERRARKKAVMSIDGESVDKIEKAKRALGSILNLIRFQPMATLEEAGTRLRLIDEFALEAFLAISDAENTEFAGAEYSDMHGRTGIYLGQASSEARGHAKIGFH